MDFLTPWIIGCVILVMFLGINAETINNFFDNVENSFEQLVTFGIHLGLFLLFLSIYLVKPIRDGLNKILIKIMAYPLKLVGTFFS